MAQGILDQRNSDQGAANMNNQLWNTLAEAELLTAKSSEAQKDLEIGSPWYVKILLAFSGWLAAIFILGFLFTLFSRFYDNTPLLIGFGVSFIIGAYFLLRINANDFVDHLALALSLAGQALLVISVDNFVTLNEEVVIWLVIALVQLPLAFIMPNFVHRVISAFMTTVGFAAALYFFQHSFNGIIIYGAFIMLITALVWLNEFRFPKHIEKLQAVGYGLVLALLTIKGTNLFMHENFWSIRAGDLAQSSWLQPWMGELLLSAVTLFVVWKILQKSHPKASEKAIMLALAGAFVLTLLSTQAQGLVTGVMVVLLGFSASNRVLLGLGIISLLFFISSYYYLLADTLMAKAITLFVLGSGLIIGRWLMLKILSDSAGRTP